MLAELKFVQGSVARKDYVAALTHFCIEKGTVRGYNGTLALSCPIPFDIECKPKADPLIKAIANCKDTIQLGMTPAGRLSIKSGKFKAFIDCCPDEVTPHVMPEGERVEVDGKAMLAAFHALEAFMADDASRPWSNGILLRDKSAFATNNVVLVEYWVGVGFPHDVNVPRATVNEVLRINEPPTHAQLSETSLTLHFEGDRWIRTQLGSTEWPDLERVLNRESAQQPVDPLVWDALEALRPFTDKMGKVFFHEEALVTSKTEGDGASYAVPGLTFDGCYQVDMLRKVGAVAKTIDWSAYPGPVIFMGDALRGAVIGMRQ